MSGYDRGSGVPTIPTVGVDPSRSRLWAQIRNGNPEMRMDETRHLRPAAWPGGGKRVFLGDVGKAALAALGAHEVPVFREMPGYDEQRWELEASSSDLVLRIRSAPYWGFGLFARCFLNEIEVTGPLAERSRFVFDLVIALGRDPWLPAWSFAFSRASGAGSFEHREAWTGLIEAGRETLREDIDRVRDRADAVAARPDSHAEALTDVIAEINSAEAALLERNAPAVARALGRAERALLYADPATRPEESEERATPTGETLSAGEARQNSLTADAVEALIREADEVSEESDESERVGLSEIEKSESEEIPFVDLT